MDVSVIIVNYNTQQITAECIDSVFNKTEGVNFEVILVDNGSTDGSRELFEKDNRIKYIYSDKNLGFGRANNLGVKQAHGDFLFFLNSDTILISNAIKEFYDFLMENQNYVLCGGQLLWPDMSLQQSIMKFPSLGSILSECLMTKHFSKVKKINHIITLNNQFVSGANLFVRTSIFNKFNGFYSGFFMYYEETDLIKRILTYHLGAFLPNVNIVHYNGASQKLHGEVKLDKRVKCDKYSKKIDILNTSVILYFRRNNPKQLLYLKFIITLSSLLRVTKIRGNIFSICANIWKR